MPVFRRCGLYYAMARGAGIGRVRPLPFVTEPLVTYSLAEQDWRILADGTTHLAEAMFAAGAERVFPSVQGHPGWGSPQEAATEMGTYGLPRERTNLMTIHLFSSCPLGEQDSVSATDSFGRVRGFENLYAADASLIPEAPGVNPQATVMALAFRIAEAFLARRGKEV
jgi:choline dehydrogenase-like flavoprotein